MFLSHCAIGDKPRVASLRVFSDISAYSGVSFYVGAFTSLDEMTIETHLIDILQQLCISGTQTFIETTEQNKKIKLENLFILCCPPFLLRGGER